MTTLFAVALLAAILLGAVAQWHSNRSRNLAILLEEQRTLAAETAWRLAVARKQMQRHSEAAACYVEHTEQLERRAAWLEQRRAVILRRWWRRKAYRRLSAWRLVGGG